MSNLQIENNSKEEEILALEENWQLLWSDLKTHWNKQRSFKPFMRKVFTVGRSSHHYQWELEEEKTEHRVLQTEHETVIETP